MTPSIKITDINARKDKFSASILIKNDTNEEYTEYYITVPFANSETKIRKCERFDVKQDSATLAKLIPNHKYTKVLKAHSTIQVDIKGEGPAPESATLVYKRPTPAPIPIPDPAPEPTPIPVPSDGGGSEIPKVVTTEWVASKLSFDKSLTPLQVKTILQLTSIFENSTPELQWNYIEDIGDQRGFTCGIVGFCSGTTDLTMVFSEYVGLTKSADAQAVKYLKALRAIDAEGKDENPSHKGLDGLPEYWKKVGGTPAMVQAQLTIADKLYVKPSQDHARALGFKLPLSLGQFYDWCLNGGEDMLQATIKSTGARGSMDEITWMTKFLDQRMKVLMKDKTWKDSVDRVKVYQALLSNPTFNLPISLTCYGDKYTLK